MKEKKITREDIQKMEGTERMKYEIAEEMGISRSYVSRIEKKAIQKLRPGIYD